MAKLFELLSPEQLGRLQQMRGEPRADQEGVFDPAALERDELVEELRARKEACADITDRLAATTGQLDRFRLARERAIFRSEMGQIGRELDRRSRLPVGMSRRQFEIERDQQAAKTRRIAERAALHAASQDANRTCCEMFVKAAARELSGDQVKTIWDRARSMFPDDPAWSAGRGRPRA